MYEIKLANVLWDRPFNLQGGGQVFYPKNIFILNLGKKKKIWLFRRKENIPGRLHTYWICCNPGHGALLKVPLETSGNPQHCLIKDNQIKVLQ
jgi:hypothetical protein